MKVIVLHGDNSDKSYERLKKFTDEAKGRSWEVINLSDSSHSVRDNLSSGSLFGSERFFVLRDFKLLEKKDMDWINKKGAGLPGNLIIYSPTLINQTLLKVLPKGAKIEEFKVPKLIWSFLDHVYPGNLRNVLTEFHEIIKTEAPEFVFSLLARQFKNLYLLKFPSNKLGLQDWQISKLKKQADRFTDSKLKDILNNLSDIDYEVKTGKAELVSSLDLFMLKHLE